MKLNWQQLVTELTDRARGGYTQVELAQKCACSQSTISELKCGATSVPKADLGLKLLEIQRLIKDRHDCTSSFLT